MAAGEAGWQGRLCAAICAPPIARLHFDPADADAELREVSKGARALFVLGFLRTWLNARAVLNDFMSGGTDLFSALLVSAMLLGCCPNMNGSFLIMFVIWACANVAIFDVLFSFLPNVLHAQQYFSQGAGVSTMFVLDNALMLVNCAIQAWMVIRVWAILDKVLPDWRNQFAWGETGRPPSGGTVGGAYAPRAMQPPAQQPLLGRPQPAQGGSFSAFQGSGQRLGSS